MANEAQGLIVCFSTTSANTTATSKAVEEVNSVNGPSGSANVIDVTHLRSDAKEKLIGLRDEGQLSIDLNFIATAANQIKLREARANRTESNVALMFNDAGRTMAAMKGYVSGFAITGAVDSKLTGTVTVEITGAVTWTTWTS